MGHKAQPRRRGEMKRQTVPREGSVGAGRVNIPVPRITYDRFDRSCSCFGHDNPALREFFNKYRKNLVPMRAHGGKSITYV